jgi:hypothetical protein
MGGAGAKNPAGVEINVNTQYLTKGGKPWMPVMGEFHYMRYPRAQWDEELKKMKAGGVTVVSTYVIWIFQEEQEGKMDWSGNKDLRAFVELCAKNGLQVALRIGPWVHSEARNGGLPDWVVEQCGARAVRTTDEKFMGLVRKFYGEIFGQVKGEMWKDGGPIVAVQIDNESTNVRYLEALKAMAAEVGFEPALWTITAWDHVRPPEKGFVPMFGGYPDGFWFTDKGVPSRGRVHYFFTPVRDDSEIVAATLSPARNSIDLSYINKYPFLTCEIGDGMEMSYARRPVMSWKDVTASALTQFGAGANLLGYYLYHGGADPLGANGEGLQEKQDSLMTNYNDMPAIDYDFQAPLGEFGQVRESYHSLGLLHAFIGDFGEKLATMPAAWPAEMPKGVDDEKTLRWVVRTDGKSGYVFVNNYERGKSLPARDFQVNLKLAGGEVRMPAEGKAAFPADTFAIFPFNLDMNGVVVKEATAQLVCETELDGHPIYVFFTPGDMKSEFGFAAKSMGWTSNTKTHQSGDTVLIEPEAGHQLIGLGDAKGRQSELLVLTQEDAMHLSKVQFAGRERLVISRGEVAVDGKSLVVTGRDPQELSFEMFPPESWLSYGGKSIAPTLDGVFGKYTISVPKKEVALEVKQVKEAGPARAVVMGPSRRPASPTEPVDADFDQAAVWQVGVPKDALAGEAVHNVLVKVDYAGDVARAYVGDRFVDDNFYSGLPWEMGLKRFMPEVGEKGLTVKILPLRKETGVWLEKDKAPAFDAKGEALEMRGITAEVEYQVEVEAGK